MKIAFSDFSLALNAKAIFSFQKDFFLEKNVFTSSKEEIEEGIFFCFQGEKFDAHNFLEEIIKKSPQVLIIDRVISEDLRKKIFAKRINLFQVKNSIKAYQDLAKFYLKFFTNLKKIAITGSVGKTTCKEILRQSLEQIYPNKVVATLDNTNNHIGVPKNIFRLDSKDKFLILELGTNAKGEIAILRDIVKPDIAIITNVKDSHIGNFGSYEELFKEKMSLLENRGNNVFALIAYQLKERAQKHLANFMTVGKEEESDIVYVQHSQSFQGEFFLIKCLSRKYQGRISMLGEAAVANLAIVYGIFYHLKLCKKKLTHLASTLNNIRGRMELVKKGENFYINDAYNASKASFLSGITTAKELSLGKRLICVFGDVLELGEFSRKIHLEIKDFFLKEIKNFFLIVVGDEMREVFGKDALFCKNLEEVKKVLDNNSKKGELIYLKASRKFSLEKILNEKE